MQRRPTAFTLLELLVVIGVVGLLMALVIPAVFQARRRAQGAECLNNLRQLALGFRLYADAHRGRFPDDQAKPWFLQIAPDAELPEEILRCPGDPTGATRSYEWRSDRAVVPETELAGKKIDLVATSRLVLVFDQEAGWHAPDTVHAADVGGAARSFTELELEDNLLLNVSTGRLFFLP